MGAFVSYDRAAIAVVLSDFERSTSSGALCLNCLSLRTREWELQDIQLFGGFWIKGIRYAVLAKELSVITLLIGCGAAFAI